MTLLEKDNYRLCTITRLTGSKVLNETAAKGLAVEKRCGFKDSTYYVICFVKYNAKEESAEIEDVGMRLLDIEDNDWPLFKDLLKTAKQFVEVANKKFN